MPIVSHRWTTAAVLWLAAVLALPAAAEEPWIAIDRPAATGGVSDPAPLVEVVGRAGTGAHRGHDVIVAIDLSGSTRLASGVDVDGDGEVGRVSGRARQYMRRGVQTTRLSSVHWSSDPEDSVRAAETAAARRFLERIPPERVRVGLVEFEESANVLAPLGSSRKMLLEALRFLEAETESRGGGTDVGAAVRTALAMFAGPEGEMQRLCTLIFLSDGVPTLPAPEKLAERQALEASEAAAAAGVRIHIYALGPETEDGLDVFRAMTERTGGRMMRPAQAGDIVQLLPETSLEDLARVEIENRTTGRPGRAVRLFADGSFDGFVSLVAGENRLSVTAETASGERVSEERVISYTPPETEDDARHAESHLARLLERIQERTAETELQREIERARSDLQERRLRLEAGTGTESDQ